MRVNFNILMQSMCGICAVLGCISALAAPDVRVVVDLSERVHKVDRAELRSQFVSEFVQFLPDDAQASIWGYTSTTERMVKHGRTDPLWRQVAEINSQHLMPRGRRSDPESALSFALWDLKRPDRGPVDVIWIGDGRVVLQNGKDPDQSRDRLIRELAPQLSSSRVRLHTLALTDASGLMRGSSAEGIALMRQLTEASGGLHRVVQSAEGVSHFARDVLRLMQAHGEARVDANGRFQIGPDTERFTVMWRRGEGDPGLRSPSGDLLGQAEPLPNGRWLVAKAYAMVTIEDPEPGWWVAQARPLKVGIWSQLSLRVEGLVSPVVPTEDTSATLKLFSGGQAVRAGEFLDRLEVRAWLIRGDSKEPLPVDRAEASFDIELADLDDGSYELEVGVLGPAFTQAATVPFVVRNPLRVDVRHSDEGASVWMAFNHAEVDYRTLRASVKIRKPPELGVVVPAEKMPDGRWRVPLNETEGILELAFSIAGNHMNKKGFYIRTKPVLVSLPLVPETDEVFRFDALGNVRKRPGRDAKAQVPTARSNVVAAGQTGADAAERMPTLQALAAVPQDTGEAVAEDEPLRAVHEVKEGVKEKVKEAVKEKANDAPIRLPLWFIGVITMVNLLVLLVIWWFLRPRSLPLPEGADGTALDSATSEKDEDAIIKAFRGLPA